MDPSQDIFAGMDEVEQTVPEMSQNSEEGITQKVEL